MLNITVKENGKTALLYCAGKIVCGDETALLCAALGQSAESIAIDLGEVEAIDASGIGALISLQAAGIYLRLLNPSKTVREILQLTRLDSLFEICGAARRKYRTAKRAAAKTDERPIGLASLRSSNVVEGLKRLQTSIIR